MTITYFTRNRYGNIDNVPYGDGSEAILQLLRRKTMLPEDMESLQALGVTFELTVPPAQS